MGSQVRKVRSDKKRDVKPVVSLEIYECVSRLSYITQRPMKDVSEHLCRKSILFTPIIERMSPYFRRDFFLGTSCYRGSLDRQPHRIDRGTGHRGRLTLRLSTELYEKIGELAYALNMTVSSATAFLLENALFEESIVVDYIETYVQKELDPNRYKQLREVIDFINLYRGPNQPVITLSKIIRHLLEEFEVRTQPIKQALSQWIERHTE